jgi:DNA-binding XRE family transcriptional regulator
LKISGKDFKKCLRMADINQKEAAILMDISRQTVNNWTKEAELSEGAVVKITKFLPTVMSLIDSRSNVINHVENINHQLNTDYNNNVTNNDIPIKGTNNENVIKGDVYTSDGGVFGDLKDIIKLQPQSEPKQLIHSNAKLLGNVYTGDESPFVEIYPGRYRLKVPLVNEYAYAGYLSGYADPEYLNELPMHEVTVSVVHKGKYRAFEIAGDSMDNGTIKCIPDGTIVTCREIKRELWKSKLHSHRWPNFIFVHRTEGIVCKQIKNQVIDSGILTLTALNPDRDMYPDFDLNMDDLLQIYNVVKREFQD